MDIGIHVFVDVQSLGTSKVSFNVDAGKYSMRRD